MLYLANYYSTHSGQGIDTRLHNARSFSAVILQQGETPELHADEPWPRRDLIATDRTEGHYDAITGTADALPKRGFVLRGKHRIQIQVLDEIAYEKFAQLPVETLTQDVHELIATQLEGAPSSRALSAERLAG